jgi:hypothetical protein
VGDPGRARGALVGRDAAATRQAPVRRLAASDDHRGRVHGAAASARQERPVDPQAVGRRLGARGRQPDSRQADARQEGPPLTREGEGEGLAGTDHRASQRADPAPARTQGSVPSGAGGAERRAAVDPDRRRLHEGLHAGRPAHRVEARPVSRPARLPRPRRVHRGRAHRLDSELAGQLRAADIRARDGAGAPLDPAERSRGGAVP